MTTPSELRGLSERATPGEWRADADEEGNIAITSGGLLLTYAFPLALQGTTQANGDFIAACVNEIRRQLSEGEKALPLWTDEQCVEFLSVAMRHVSIDGEFSMQEIRQGQDRANRLYQTKAALSAQPNEDKPL